MKICGWGKTKTVEVFALIRAVYDYPTHRKDIQIKHFCNYLELDEKDVQEALQYMQ